MMGRALGGSRWRGHHFLFSWATDQGDFAKASYPTLERASSSSSSPLLLLLLTSLPPSPPSPSHKCSFQEEEEEVVMEVAPPAAAVQSRLARDFGRQAGADSSFRGRSFAGGHLFFPHLL
jgi:hypothetical protein